MHGRPRKPAKPEDEAAAADKAAKLRTLQSQFLHYHHHKIYDEEAMVVSTKLLEINPEYYTAWNYRKMAVDHHLASLPDSIDSILKEELDVATAALKRNFKSYGAWHHRKWVLSKGHSSLDKELGLINLFQEADSRNFHAWNHRRFVADLKKSSEIDELEYTKTVIERNISNYSGWHNRSMILLSLLKKKAEGFFPKEKILDEEYDMVHNAIFTDPDDQCGWFYYLWLLDQTINLEAPSLISSWPSPGSDLLLSVGGSAGPDVSRSGSYHADRGIFPLILYFNEPVKGISSSTVIVKSSFTENAGLTWIPVSAVSDSARAWVAFVDVSNVVCGSSGIYPVEVRCEHLKGISSLSGFHITDAFTSNFVVHIHLFDSIHATVQDTEVISWKDCNFQKYDGHTKESLEIPVFNQFRIHKDHDSVSSKWSEDTLTNEISVLRDLLAESDCKIGNLMLARVLAAFDTMLPDGTSNYRRVPYLEEVLQLYSDLVTLDPLHLQYYKDQHSFALLRQMTSSRETLWRHCWQYRDSSASSVTCLRLNNLSLTQIASIQNLLWFQMLDLSQNELRSINGLEAMQVLSCLNLSNNKLSSFTALDPLRRLKSLKVLNISNNEIGGHSIDTTRYLCSSPLSFTVGVDRKSDALPLDNAIMVKHWEAVLVFKDLKLTQLDIAGNPVVDEDFMLLLRHLLPKLVWLDGHRLSTV